MNIDDLIKAKRYIQDYVYHLTDFRSLIKQERKNKNDRNEVVRKITDKIDELKEYLEHLESEVKDDE